MLNVEMQIQARAVTSSSFTLKTRSFPTGVSFKIFSMNSIVISIIWQSILSKYVGDFLFLLKEGEEEEPVVHNEAAVFR